MTHSGASMLAPLCEIVAAAEFLPTTPIRV
jgi:hypothetical protein